MMPLEFVNGKWQTRKVSKKGYPIKEYMLSDHDGKIIYKTGTKNEVADYALRHMLLIVDREGEDETNN